MNADVRRALRENWRVLLAATAGWALDAFDFTMLLFLIPHLREVFGASLPEMAFVVTATGLAKVVGTIGWGAAADRFGMKCCPGRKSAAREARSCGSGEPRAGQKVRQAQPSTVL